MALTTSNVKHEGVKSFMEGLVLADTSWRKVQKFHADDEASLRIAALTGIGNTPSWDGTADLTTATVDSTGATTLTYAAYGMQVLIPKYDTLDVPGIVQAAADKLGRSVGATYATTAWGIYGDAFATETTADTKYLCATDHTMTSGTRSNKGTSALDRTALEAAITALANWQNYQTQKYNLSRGKLFLIVSPTLMFTAHQVVNSMFTSSNLQQNVLAGMPIEVLVSEYLSDANDWFVQVDPGVEAPIHFWERSGPDFSVALFDQDNRKTKLNVDFAVVVDAGPQPDGIYGSSVT